MKNKCEHIWFAYAPNVKRCSKCSKEILVWPLESYSMKEFRKMYPLRREHEAYDKDINMKKEYK